MKEKVDQLVNDWIEGDLDPEDADALRDLLTEDPSARQRCYDLVLLDQLLSEREEAGGALFAEPSQRSMRRNYPLSRIIAGASIAALIAMGLWIAMQPDVINSARISSPPITASSDSRITIAQREDRSHWAPGELLRLERGTAAIRFGKGVLAHIEGPAAVELADVEGDIRFFEGRGSFQVDPGARTFKIETAGGTLRGSGSQFVCQISPDQAALVEVNSGTVEIATRTGRGPFKIAAGEAVRLEMNGAVVPTARPGIPFRAGLPEELALFLDDFQADDGASLSQRAPVIGQPWEVSEELNPTVIRAQRLDTSAGARRLVAHLAPHQTGGTGSVYVFSFSLVPPAWTHDKVHRLDGIESIALIDPQGHELFSLVAEAVNTHRWQLKGGGETTPLTPVCALWDHQITVCYGLDGRVTVHDGGTAQAPVIAKLWLKDPAAVAGIRISNRTGGDLAFRRIGATLLRVPQGRDE